MPTFHCSIPTGIWIYHDGGFTTSLGLFGALPIFAHLVHVVSQKWLIVEQNGLKFGPQACVFIVYSVLLTVECSSSVWGHSVHFRFSPTLYMLYLGNG